MRSQAIRDLVSDSVDPVTPRHPASRGISSKEVTEKAELLLQGFSVSNFILKDGVNMQETHLWPYS